MLPDLSVKNHRLVVAASSSILMTAPLFITSKSVYEFVGFTFLAVFFTVLTTEICYRTWKKFGGDSRYLKILGSVAVALTVLLSLLFVFVLWASFTNNTTSCLKTGEKPVENRFTGKCTRISACGTTPWYYKNGCTSGSLDASEMCLSQVQSLCNIQKGEKIEKPSLCDQQNMPDRYQDQNGYIICPN